MRRLLTILLLSLAVGCVNVNIPANPYAPNSPYAPYAPNAPYVPNAAPIPTVTNVVNVTNIVNITNVMNITNVVNITNIVVITKVVEVTNYVGIARAAVAAPPVVVTPPVAVNDVARQATSPALPAVRDGLVREDERGKWRFSAGASVIGGIRPKLDANNAALQGLSGFGRLFGGRSKLDAYAAGSGGGDPNGVRRFDGGAWYDPTDSASMNDPDWSWNWRLHDPAGADPDGRAGFTERTRYAEPTSSSEGGYSDESPEWFPGLRVELARELYRSDDKRPWGVDAAAAFAYYFQRGLWKASGTAARSGYYEWWNDSDDTARHIFDYARDTQFRDGMWGAGSLDGPGPELESSAWKFRDVAPGSDGQTPQALNYRASGDYREYSIELIARPWWEPWPWLRLFGTVGLEVSRREFEWWLNAWGNDGSYYRERGTARDWRALGLLGGGLASQWDDFVLAGEALWRFGGDDLDVTGRSLRGGIGRAKWGFRLSLGYEF